MVKLATLDYIRPNLQAFIPRFSDVIPKQKSPFSPQTKNPRTPTASSSPSPPPDHHHFLLLFLLLLHIDYRHLYIHRAYKHNKQWFVLDNPISHSASGLPLPCNGILLLILVSFFCYQYLQIPIDSGISICFRSKLLKEFWARRSLKAEVSAEGHQSQEANTASPQLTSGDGMTQALSSSSISHLKRSSVMWVVFPN